MRDGKKHSITTMCAVSLRDCNMQRVCTEVVDAGHRTHRCLESGLHQLGLCCGIVWFALVWCGVVWCRVVWCGVVWCGVVWYDVVWFGVVWCGVMWFGVVWCGLMWCGAVQCGLQRCGVVRCGAVRCGVVWCDVVWCGVVWYGLVCAAKSLPLATRSSRQQHQVDLKDRIPMWQPRDDVILAFWIQIHPVLLNTAVVLCQCIAQQLCSVCEGCIGRKLD